MTTECKKINEVNITQGADKTFFINLTVSEDRAPAKAFKLDPNPTTVEIRMPDKNDSVLRLNLGAKVLVDDPDGGVLKVVMPEADTDVLSSVEEGQDIEVKIVQDIPTAGTTTFFLLEGVLFVKPQRFPETP